RHPVRPAVRRPRRIHPHEPASARPLGVWLHPRSRQPRGPPRRLPPPPRLAHGAVGAALAPRPHGSGLRLALSAGRGSPLGECPPAFGLLLDFAQRATPPGSAYRKRVACTWLQEATERERPSGATSSPFSRAR